MLWILTVDKSLSDYNAPQNPCQKVMVYKVTKLFGVSFGKVGH